MWPLAIPAPPPTQEFKAVLIDVARNPHSIRSLEEIVLWCEAGEVPYIVLHLTDDQNWMMPSHVLPGVDEHNAAGRPAYTRQELIRLQLFAEARNVRIIPEVDMPGHSALLVRHNPALFKIQGSESHNCVNFAKPEVREVLKRVIGEVADLFPSAPYIHLGGDEAWYAGAENDPHFQAAFRALGPGVRTEHVFADFLGEMAEAVIAKGRTPLIWEGFGPDPWTKRRLPPETVVIAWEGNYYAPQRLLADGYRVVNAGWDPFYVVNHYPYDLMTLLPLERLVNHNPQSFGLVQRTEGFGAPISATGPYFMGTMMCWWEGREWHVRDVLGPRIIAFGRGGLDGLSYEEVVREIDRVRASLPPRVVPAPPAIETPRPSLTTGRPIMEVLERDPIYGPQNLTDGIVREDRYWLAFPTPQIVTVDLGRVQQVGRINVTATPIGQGTPSYRVLASVDNDNWQLLIDRIEHKPLPTLEGFDDKITPVRARYLRLEVTKNSTHPNFMARICEFSAFAE